MMRLKPRSPLLPAVALLAATASCDRPQEDAAAPPAFTIRDSAGIEIVESHAPEWDEADSWTVATEPAYPQHLQALPGDTLVVLGLHVRFGRPLHPLWGTAQELAGRCR